MLTLIRQHKLKCGTNLISYVTLLRLGCIIITLSRTQNVSEKNACLFLLGGLNFIIFCLTPFRNCVIYSPLKNKRTVFLFVCKEYIAQREQPSDCTDSPLSSPYSLHSKIFLASSFDQSWDFPVLNGLKTD